jgi:hypothetical protein
MLPTAHTARGDVLVFGSKSRVALRDYLYYETYLLHVVDCNCGDSDGGYMKLFDSSFSQPRMRYTVLVLTVLLLLLSSLPELSVAQWSKCSAGNAAICAGAGSQSYPGLVSDGSGGVIAAWCDSRSGTPRVYAQRISSRGEVVWGSPGVLVCSVVGLESYPRLVSDGAGGAIIAWEDNRSHAAVYAQRIDGSGTPLWTTDGVAICSEASPYQIDPQLVGDGSGGAIIAWYNTRVYVQRINASGKAQWATDGVAVCTATGGQYYPRLVGDGLGGAIITWANVQSELTGMYAQRVNASGVVQWTASGVPMWRANGEGVQLIGDGAGGAIITWYDTLFVYTQRVNPQGTKQWKTDGVQVYGAANKKEQGSPQLVGDGASGAIITWYDKRGADEYIHAQRVNASGAVQWAVNAVEVCTGSDVLGNPQIVSDSTGGAIITWADGRSGGIAIYAQRVSAIGVTQWTSNGVILSSSTGSQYAPEIIKDGANGAICAWLDNRSGSRYDISVERVNALGVIQWVSVAPEKTVQCVAVIDSTVMAGTSAVFRSTNMGTIWKPMSNGIPPSTAIYNFAATGSSIFAGTSVGVYRCAKSETSWTASSTGLPNGSVYALAVKDSILFVGLEAAGVYRSSNGGVSWTWANRGLTNLNVRCLAVKRDQYLYAGTLGGVFRSTDNGVNWDSLNSGLGPPIEVLALAFNGTSLMTLTGDMFTSALFRTTNNGLSWTDLSASVANLSMWVLAADPYPAGAGGSILYGGGFGSGVRASTDNGENWIGVNDGLDSKATTIYSLAASRSYLFAGTGRGIWRRPLSDLNYLSVEPTASGLSTGFRLDQNYPNPFNPSTTIQYALPSRSHVRLTIFNTLGQIVRELVNGEMSAGYHEVQFDATGLSSGVYFYRLQAGTFIETKRLLFLR